MDWDAGFWNRSQGVKLQRFGASRALPRPSINRDIGDDNRRQRRSTRSLALPQRFLFELGSGELETERLKRAGRMLVF